MICSKCGMSYDDSKTKCPYCDELNPAKAQAGETEIKDDAPCETTDTAAKVADEPCAEQETTENTEVKEEISQETSDKKEDGFTSSNVNQQQPPKCEPAPSNVNGLAIGSMVCGIISLPLIFTIFGGLVLGIVAIVLAANSKKQYGSSGYAVAGLVCGIISIIISAIVIIVFVVALALAASVAASYGTNILSDIISIG